MNNKTTEYWDELGFLDHPEIKDKNKVALALEIIREYLIKNGYENYDVSVLIFPVIVRLIGDDMVTYNQLELTNKVLTIYKGLEEYVKINTYLNEDELIKNFIKNYNT